MKNYPPLVFLLLLTTLMPMNTTGAENTISNTIDVAQTLTISSTPPTTGAINTIGGGAYQHTAWIITTNNAFTITFSGTSENDTGTEPLPYPSFTKQDRDVSGALIANNWDHILTLVGLTVTSHSSLTGSATWGGGSAASSGSNWLVATTGSLKPNLGSIMTNDDTGTAVVTLTAYGQSYTKSQSGNYTMTVTATATADEKL